MNSLSFIINLVVNKKGEGRGGLIERGGLNNFLSLKRGVLLERGGLFERGGDLIEDLRYFYKGNDFEVMMRNVENILHSRICLFVYMNGLLS